MSFNEMREKPIIKKYGLRSASDWLVEEKKFKAELPIFLKDIEKFNQNNSGVEYVYEPEKINQPETLNNKEVKKDPENKTKFLQDAPNVFVELDNVREIPTIGLPTLQPAQPKESDLSSNNNADPFDSISSNNDPANPPTKHEEDIFGISPKTEVKSQPIATKKIDIPLDDEFFNEPVSTKASTPATAAKPTIPQPKSSDASSSPEASKAASSAKPAMPSTLKPAMAQSAPEGAALAEFSQDRPSGDLLEIERFATDKFDFEDFKRVVATCARMLSDLPDIDLNRIENNIGEYSVSLDLDHMRDNPNILCDRLIEVQQKRDSLYSLTLRFNPLATIVDEVADYIKKAGISCSSESNADKRASHILRAVPNFWTRVIRINSVKVAVEGAFRTLADQYECISRCITFLQIKNKIGDISRGPVAYEESNELPPFDPPYKTVVHPRPMPLEASTEQQKAPGKVPVAQANDDIVNRTMSQPLSSKKFQNLEGFDSGSKPAKKQNSITPGEHEW